MRTPDTRYYPPTKKPEKPEHFPGKLPEHRFKPYEHKPKKPLRKRRKKKPGVDTPTDEDSEFVLYSGDDTPSDHDSDPKPHDSD